MRPEIEEHGDDAIRREFQELRDVESEQLPAFGDVVARPRRRSWSRYRSVGAMAAAAAILFAAVMMFPKKPAHSPSTVTPVATIDLPFDEWSQLIAETAPAPTGTDTTIVWNSTTDFLLNIPQIH